MNFSFHVQEELLRNICYIIHFHIAIKKLVRGQETEVSYCLVVYEVVDWNSTAFAYHRWKSSNETSGYFNEERRRGRTLQSSTELVIWPTSEVNPDPLWNVLYLSSSLLVDDTGLQKRNAWTMRIRTNTREKITILSRIVRRDHWLRRNCYFIYFFIPFL